MYLGMTALFGGLVYLILRCGKQLEPSGSPLQHAADTRLAGGGTLAEGFGPHLLQPLPVLLLQILVIVITARLFGYLFSRIRQPVVMGEIVAGVVLGPSLFGWIFPGASALVFPPSSLDNLQLLSQIGLILFMFVIGMELETGKARSQALDALIISHASILIPYTMGVGLSYFLYREFAPARIHFLSFALFMGIAMSVTAFPVLARILREKGLSRTPLGSLALTCAASDDVTAWCILAAVIAVARAGSPLGALYTMGIAGGYAAFMWWVLRPLLEKLENAYGGRLKGSLLALVFAMVLTSAYICEMIGIHALFGAFLAGVVMPSGIPFRTQVTDKIEDISVVLLLPLFFVFTGLRTRIGMLDSGHLWATCGWIILVAVAGKFGGSACSARLVGQSWKDCLSIGALMNTRGLMELVVLNIGYDLGILSQAIFTMLVLMALLTTMMTGPFLDWIAWCFREPKRPAVSQISRKTNP